MGLLKKIIKKKKRAPKQKFGRQQLLLHEETLAAAATSLQTPWPPSEELQPRRTRTQAALRPPPIHSSTQKLASDPSQKTDWYSLLPFSSSGRQTSLPATSQRRFEALRTACRRRDSGFTPTHLLFSTVHSVSLFLFNI